MNSGGSIWVRSKPPRNQRSSKKAPALFIMACAVVSAARGQNGQSTEKRLSRSTRSQLPSVAPLKAPGPHRRKNASRQRIGCFEGKLHGRGFNQFGRHLFAFRATVATPPLGGQVARPGVFNDQIAKRAPQVADGLEPM